MLSLFRYHRLFSMSALVCHFATLLNMAAASTRSQGLETMTQQGFLAEITALKAVCDSEESRSYNTSYRTLQILCLSRLILNRNARVIH